MQRLIDGLVSPNLTPAEATETKEALAFHVVCPSIPGFGFSDASEEAEFGASGAAGVFGALMRRLGYEEYVVCGGGWGFEVAKALAAKEPRRVLGLHTWNPVFAAPAIKTQPAAWVKWQLAKIIKARHPAVSFGYTPSEVAAPALLQDQSATVGRPLGPAMHQLFSLRPQTLAFSLCDSPVGLLAVLLDLVATQGPAAFLAVRPRSPFLDPGELEMQDRDYEAAGHERVRSDETVKAPNRSVDESVKCGSRAWSPTDILNWTMM